MPFTPLFSIVIVTNPFSSIFLSLSIRHQKQAALSHRGEQSDRPGEGQETFLMFGVVKVL